MTPNKKESYLTLGNTHKSILPFAGTAVLTRLLARNREPSASLRTLTAPAL